MQTQAMQTAAHSDARTAPDADWTVENEADVMQALDAILAYHQRKIDSIGEVPVAALKLPHGSTTAVMMLVTRLLKSANVEIFELGMWQSFSGYRPE